jgi:putative ABC transport system permease protein
MRDIRYAFRAFLRKPGFSAMVVGLLALGIAGNAAIFSIFNGLFLRPLPYLDPAALVDIDETAPRWNLEYTGVAYPNFHDWREHNRSFASMAAYDSSQANLSGEGDAERIEGALVTHDLGRTLGVNPLLGRDFLAAEDQPNGPKVAVIAEGMWTRRFGRDPNVLGRSVRLNNEPYTIVGVLPGDLLFPGRAELWVPLGADPNEMRGWYLNSIARLKPGVTIDQARADLTQVHRNQIPRRQVNEITSPVLQPVRDRLLGQYRTVTTTLLIAVAVVLLIACVNVAGLMLVRGSARARELAIRTALGASRGRVVRQLLVDSVLLAAAGGALGVAAGYWLLEAMLRAIPQEQPVWVSFAMDWRFAAFCTLMTAGAALLFGLLPSVRASRVDLRGALQEAARSSGGRSRHRLLNGLVAGEVALAVMLLVTAGLLFQTFRQVMRVDPGFRAANVLTYSVSLPSSRYPKDEQRLRFYEELTARTKTIPGVIAAGAATAPPLSGHWGNFFEVEGARPLGPNEQDPVVLQTVATPGYLQAIGVTFASGRDFTTFDGTPNGPRVALVNETFAKRYWPNGNPLGKRLRNRCKECQWMEVVGVIRDTKHYGLDQSVRPNVIMPLAQMPRSGLFIVVRTAVPPESLVNPSRELLRQLDAELPMFDVRTMTERLERSLWVRRFSAWLIGSFAAVALLLAVAGIYGVVSYAVAQRTHEIGLRMALGAQPTDVLRQVLGRGMVLAGAGVAVGIVGALALSRMLQQLLFEVSPRDPLVYAAVVGALAVVALLANALPARRAASVDPMRALRFE